MDHPLTGVRAKLARGEYHTKTLERELDRIFKKPRKRGHITIRKEIDAENGKLRLRVAKVYRLSPRVGLIAADAIHNFRSALDQLLFEMAFIDLGGKQDKALERLMFPASLTPENFSGHHVQDVLLAGLTQEHRALVDRFQPYNGTERPIAHHPVALLDALSNDDKHRLTQPAFVTSHSFSVRIEDMRDCAIAHPIVIEGESTGGRPLDVDTQLASVNIVVTGPNPEVDVQPINMEVFVGLRNGLDLWGVLSGIGKYCRGIVEVFSPEFETSEAVACRGLTRPGRIDSGPALPPDNIEIELF